MSVGALAVTAIALGGYANLERKGDQGGMVSVASPSAPGARAAVAADATVHPDDPVAREAAYLKQVSQNVYFHPGEPLTIFQTARPLIPCETHNAETICMGGNVADCPSAVPCIKASYFFAKGIMTGWNAIYARTQWNQLYSEISQKLGDPERADEASNDRRIGASIWQSGAVSVKGAIIRTSEADGAVVPDQYMFLIGDPALERQLGASWAPDA